MPKSESKPCKHEDFRACVDVNRLEDSGAFVADIRINCLECGIAFDFPPLPIGLCSHEARLNFDGTELRVPIKPHDRDAFRAFVGFGVKRTA